MAIHSRGYVPENIETAHEKALFLENLHLILQHQQQILNSKPQFFCPLRFAWCSWPYVGGDGPLPLGYLLLGWRDGLFTEPSPSCNGKVLVTFFGGSPLSGSCAWAGFCTNCNMVRSAGDSVHKPFFEKIKFVLQLRQEFPQSVSYWEEFDGHDFSWSGNGLQPARKKRVVHKHVVKPVTLDEVISKLGTNAIT